MKTIKAILIFASILIALSSCGGRDRHTGGDREGLTSGSGTEAVDRQHDSLPEMHRQHRNLADDFAHKDIYIPENPYEPDQEEKQQMEGIIDAYLEIGDALFAEDEGTVDDATELMAERVGSVSSDSLDGAGLEAWQNHLSLYLVKLREMSHIRGLENKRSYFSHISEILYYTIKSFGLKEGSLYAVYCPMAFDSKGAYWIADSKIIKNPYLGKDMETCGEIRENL